MWKKINEERAADSPFSQKFIEIAMNLGRMAQCMYQYGDGHGVVDRETKKRILSLFIYPVPLHRDQLVKTWWSLSFYVFNFEVIRCTLLIMSISSPHAKKIECVSSDIACWTIKDHYVYCMLKNFRVKMFLVPVGSLPCIPVHKFTYHVPPIT